MEVLPMTYNYGNDTSPEMDLLAASSIGDLGLVHRLLQQGAIVDAPNESGWTPLMYAAHYGHYNVVKMLIDYGANVNIAEKIQGRTPLMLAASCGHTRCLEVLITLGAADIEMTDLQGHNAAYYAIHSGHGRNKIIAKLLKIQGKNRSSSSSNAVSSSSASVSCSSGNSAARSRPLTKGRSEVSTNGNINGKNLTSRGHQNSSISSNKITSTSKPDIIVSQDTIGTIIEDSSPFPNGNGNHKRNDDNGACGYYSPYLSLSRDGSPIGGQFSPSHFNISPSTAISSPFNGNNGLTPQLTFDRLIGKRRLPMGNQNDRYSGQPSKTSRLDQVTTTNSTSNSSTAYNALITSNGPSSSTVSSSSSGTTSTASTTTAPTVSITTTEEFTSKEMNNLIDEACRLNSAYSLNDYSVNRRASPGIIGSQLKGPSPSSEILLSSPNCSGDNNDTSISISAESGSNVTCASSPSIGANSGDEVSLAPFSSDISASSSSSINRSRSPLPENLDSLLERIGLSQYGSLFKSHGIDLYCFMTLNESDFEEIGITLLGHKRKLYMAQLRFRESVEIASTQERFFADWLLSERENLKKENHELKMKLKGLESVNNSIPLYN